MDAVTMEGDEVNRKGALQGGFIDQAKSKLASYESMKKSQEKLDKLDKDISDLSKKTTTIDQRISSLVGEIQKMEAKRSNLKVSEAKSGGGGATDETGSNIYYSQLVLENSVKEMGVKRTRGDARRVAAEEQAETLPVMRRDVNQMQQQILRLKAEIGTPLSATLSDAERTLLTSIRESEKLLVDELEEKNAKLEIASVEKEKVTSLLNDNLLKRKAVIEDSLNASR